MQRTLKSTREADAAQRVERHGGRTGVQRSGASGSPAPPLPSAGRVFDAAGGEQSGGFAAPAQRSAATGPPAPPPPAARVYGPEVQRAARRHLLQRWTEFSAVRGAPVQRVLSGEAQVQIGQMQRSALLARVRHPVEGEEPGEIATAWLAAHGNQNDTEAWATLLRDAGLLDGEAGEELEAEQEEAAEDHEPLSAEAQRERIALEAQERAHDFLAVAEGYLEDALEGEDALLFGRVFGDGAELAALRTNLARMSEYLADTTLLIAYVQGEQTAINAVTLQGVITLRTPFFDRLDDDARRNTVIHETVHAALNVPDFAYTTERLIDLLSTRAALSNPDSYVWFLSGILQNQREPRGNFQDVYPDDMEHPRRAEARKAIALMVSAFRQTNLLFVQAHEDANAAVKGGRPVANNTAFCIQEVKRVFTGPSQQWNPEQPTAGLANGLGQIARVVEYLMGGLVAPVTISNAGAGPLAWARVGQAPATLSLPADIAGGDLYSELLTVYVRDLLSPTRGEKWKSFQALVVNVGRRMIDMDDYRGTVMSFPHAAV